MAFTDRSVEFPGRVELTNVSGDIYDMTAAEGTVYTAGTLLNATNLNKETQLDPATEAKYTAAGAGSTTQNPMSDALDFLISNAVVKSEYNSGVWHVREWSNGIVEEWAHFDKNGTFTAWSPLAYFDATSPDAQPVSGGTILCRLAGGYCEGQTTWTGMLSGGTTVRFITNGTPSGTKAFHAYIYIIKATS